MTDLEIDCIEALRHVTLLPGIPAKRFINDMRAQSIGDPNSDLTSKQNAYLMALVWRYRRQIKNEELVEFCRPIPARYE